MAVYVPILKGKLGEFIAWQNAGEQVLSITRPIFEVVPEEGAGADLPKFLRHAVGRWPADQGAHLRHRCARSGIGARISPPGSGHYAAAKAALEAMTSSLRKEVAPLGITAMSVEPGGFRTDFAGRSLTQSAAAIADYADTAGQRRKENDTADGRQPGDPAKAATAIIAAVESADPPLLLVLGTDAVTSLGEILDAQRAELEAWRELGTSTDFD